MIGALIVVFGFCAIATRMWLWWIVGSVLFWGGNVHVATLAAVALCAQGLGWIALRTRSRRGE